MDKRAFTTDPNANVSTGSAAKWWESLGPTQRPSPYATASWRYLQDFTIDIIEIPVDVTNIYDNGADFTKPVYPIVWDGGLFNPPVPPAVVLDGGGFNSSGGIVTFSKTTFATVYVYDVAASYPDVRGLNSIVLDKGDLAIDPGEGVSQFISTEANLQIETEAQEDMAVDPIGSLQFLSTEDGFFIELTATAQTVDDTPPGKLLGQLDYILTETRVDVVGWSHYNWQDAAPVKQAFRAMTRSLPPCVDGIYVKDSPTAFWTDLGFRTQAKGDTELKYLPVTYRGY